MYLLWLKFQRKHTLILSNIRELNRISKYNVSYLYMLGVTNLRPLELVNKKNLILELTQENSIENSVQDSLPYILNPHGLC